MYPILFFFGGGRSSPMNMVALHSFLFWLQQYKFFLSVWFTYICFNLHAVFFACVLLELLFRPYFCLLVCLFDSLFKLYKLKRPVNLQNSGILPDRKMLMRDFVSDRISGIRLYSLVGHPAHFISGPDHGPERLNCRTLFLKLLPVCQG